MASAPATPGLPRRRTRWWLVGWLLPVLLAVALLAGLQTRSGIDVLLRLAGSLSNGALQLDDWQGRWLSDVELRGLRIRAGTTLIRIDRLQLRWAPQQLWQRRLHVDTLQLGRLEITTAASKHRPQMPVDLQLPLALQIDHFGCDSLTLLPAGVTLSALAGSLQADHGQYRVGIERLHSPWGSASANATLAMRAPFALRGTADLNLGLQGRVLRAQLRADGNLAEIRLQANGHSGAVQLAAHASARPFAPTLVQQLPRAQIHASGIDLRQWLTGAPASDAQLELDIHPERQALLLGFELHNQLAGRIDAGRLPLRSARGEARLTGEQLQLRLLDAELPRGRLAAWGSASTAALDLQLRLADVDVSAVHGRLLPTSLAGQLQLSGSPRQPQIAGKLSDPRVAAQLDVGLSGAPAAPRLTIRQLNLSTRQALAAASGTVDFAGKRGFDLEVALRHFNPAAFGKFPPAELNGSVGAIGQLAPAPRVRLALAFKDSQFNHQPLQANGSLLLEPQRLQQTLLQLQLGANRLRLDGALGRPGDTLQLHLDAPDFAVIGNGWHGLAHVDATLTGALRQPAIDGSAQLEQLQTPFGASVARLLVQARWPNRPGEPLALQASASKLALRGQQFDELRLNLQGELAAHQLQLDGVAELRGKPTPLSLSAHGGWAAASGWSGSVDRLRVAGDIELALQSPLTLQAAPGRLTLGPAVLEVAGGRLQLQRSEWAPGNIALQGALDGVELARLLQLGRAAPAAFATDLRLAGSWNLAYRDGWSGQARIARSGGDLQVRQGGNSEPIPLLLQQAELQLNAQPGRIALSGLLQTRDYGRAEMLLQLWPAGAALLPSGDTPLSAQMTLDVPSLAWLGSLLSPQLAIGGQLEGQMAAQGVLGNFQWSGGLSGDNLTLRNPDWGMNYGAGTLRAAVAPSGIYINECHFRSGDGTLDAQGEMLFGEQSTAGRLQVTTSQFVAMNRPDLQLTVSGTTGARLADGKLDLSGALRADNGFFRFTKGGMPALSDDVLIVGRSEAKANGKQKLPVSIVLDLDLGERLRFEGWGIKTGLTGSVRVKSIRGQPLNVSGTVRSQEGRYSAYGQDLKITRGALAFQGALDNPGLDVIAVREHLAVEPGIHLTGSLQAPRLTLVADSDMSEHEKLSWLILGRPPAEGSQQKADADILIAAASALLSRDDSTSLQQQLASRFGIDEIGLRSRSIDPGSATAGTGSSAAATQQVVAIGKRLSDKAYVVYEQGVDAASAAVKLTYRVSRHWSLVAKAGQESQFDVFWNLWFD